MKVSQNKVTGLLCLLFSLFFIYQAFQIEPPPSATMDFLGPRGFPFIIGSQMVLCSLGILFLSKEEGNEDNVGLSELKSLIPYLLLILVFILLVPYLGMFIGLFLLTFVMVRIMEKGKIIQNLIVSVCVSFAIWIVFDILLNLSMPMWPSL
ncbi:tripartite tricarboxylate transporter TctB family protein [Tenuibacillus multivorans]|uniref:Tripartite tricarboxylate transporter TctB family protein n=1 Tax=Tenuibacillus multivorans TaxID=237069 RepID=A0A1H0BNX5_9BACI|nr:tripartite tricarboxylate transporter TctB family protein [Tenuibacillus multivorans]GEL77095.1 hypothetical protein TMU01_13300 [Tenuibacillus multivorans]SDN47272.1 Tripartite tricarboxylate transporter TctB family protein [Tenuibacillus multivorans]